MRNTINFLKNYIPPMELQTLVSGFRKHGKASYFAEQLKDIEREIRGVPPLYTNEHLGKDAPIKLHYFGGATDFWFSELDPESGDAFGYACVNGDSENAEFGYSNIQDIITIPWLELDLFWDDKTTFRQVIGR